MLMKNSSFSFFKRSFPSLIFILFSALYLTFLVNLQTLETAMQRVFIFCYFVVMGVLACFLKGKYAEGKPDRRGAARRAAHRRRVEYLPAKNIRNHLHALIRCP